MKFMTVRKFYYEGSWSFQIQIIENKANIGRPKVKAGNTKGGSITVLLTSCLTGVE